MSSRKRQMRQKRRTIKSKNNLHRNQKGGSRGSVVGPISPLAQEWILRVRDRFASLKQDDVERAKGFKNGDSSEKSLESIPNYAIPFPDEPGLDYSVGRNDLRNWGITMANTLNYNGDRYTMRDFFMNISMQNAEFTAITLNAYLELENTIRKSLGDDSAIVTPTNIGNPEMQPFYILAVLASADKNGFQAPIVFSG